VDAVLRRSFAHRTVIFHLFFIYFLFFFIGGRSSRPLLRASHCHRPPDSPGFVAHSLCVCVCVCVTHAYMCPHTTMYVSLCYYYTAHHLVIGLQIRQVSKNKKIKNKNKTGGACLRIVIGLQIRQVYRCSYAVSRTGRAITFCATYVSTTSMLLCPCAHTDSAGAFVR
jgi:hypothetical protein